MKKYHNGSIYEIDKKLVEDALVKLFLVEKIDDLNIQWHKAETDPFVLFTTLSMSQITRKYSSNIEEILFVNQLCWDEKTDKEMQVFYNDLFIEIEKIDSSISIKRDVWRVSLTDEYSLDNFSEVEPDKMNSYVYGTPSSGKYIFFIR